MLLLYAIAYAIELTPTTKKNPDPTQKNNDPVLKAGVEGEHLCLLVELSSDVVSSLPLSKNKYVLPLSITALYMIIPHFQITANSPIIQKE